MWDYWVQFNLAWIEFELNTLENISQGHIFRSCVPPLVHMLCNISMLYSVGRVIMAKPPRVYDDHSSEAPGGHWMWGSSEAGPVPESWLLVCIHWTAVAQAVARNDLPTTQSLTIDHHKPDQQEREDLKQLSKPGPRARLELRLLSGFEDWDLDFGNQKKL